METYPVDMDPEQIVTWLMEEQRQGRSDFLITATRSLEPGEIKGGKSRWLSEDDREDVDEIVEVAVLEVTPRRDADRWTLRIRVEDDIGPRQPADDPLREGEEEIDLGTFTDEYVRPGRGLAEVTVEAANDRARASSSQILSAIMHNRHGRSEGGGGRAARSS